MNKNVWSKLSVNGTTPEDHFLSIKSMEYSNILIIGKFLSPIYQP